MHLIDSHCHLDAPEFDPDRPGVIARARAAGVRRQLVPAVDRAGWEKLRDLCAAHAGLRPAYGLHPMFLDRHRPSHLDDLAQWLADERPAAVGECGLDHFVTGLDPDAHAIRGPAIPPVLRAVPGVRRRKAAARRGAP